MTGDLNQQIDIQHRADTVNGLGEAVPTWQALHAGVWAQHQPLRGRELLAANQLHAPVEARFRIRFRPGITPAMRVLHKGVAYDIVGQPVDVDGAGRTLEIMCTAGARDGR